MRNYVKMSNVVFAKIGGLSAKTKAEYMKWPK